MARLLSLFLYIQKVLSFALKRQCPFLPGRNVPYCISLVIMSILPYCHACRLTWQESVYGQAVRRPTLFCTDKPCLSAQKRKAIARENLVPFDEFVHLGYRQSWNSESNTVSQSGFIPDYYFTAPESGAIQNRGFFVLVGRHRSSRCSTNWLALTHLTAYCKSPVEQE